MPEASSSRRTTDLRKLIQTGFSMVEIMVAVAIAGILTTLGVMAVQQYLLKARQAEALKNLDVITGVYVAELGSDINSIPLPTTAPTTVADPGMPGSYTNDFNQSNFLGIALTEQPRYKYWFLHGLVTCTFDGTTSNFVILAIAESRRLGCQSEPSDFLIMGITLTGEKKTIRYRDVTQDGCAENASQLFTYVQLNSICSASSSVLAINAPPPPAATPTPPPPPPTPVPTSSTTTSSTSTTSSSSTSSTSTSSTTTSSTTSTSTSTSSTSTSSSTTSTSSTSSSTGSSSSSSSTGSSTGSSSGSGSSSSTGTSTVTSTTTASTTGFATSGYLPSTGYASTSSTTSTTTTTTTSSSTTTTTTTGGGTSSSSSTGETLTTCDCAEGVFLNPVTTCYCCDDNANSIAYCGTTNDGCAEGYSGPRTCTP